MTPLLVAVVGTSCTGKTTLCEAAAALPGVTWVPEAARAYFQRNPGLSAPTSTRLVLCEQGVLGAPAYLHALGHQQAADHLHQRCSHWHYDHVLYPNPTDVPYRQDDVRTETATTRQRIHQGFLDFLHHHHIPYTTLTGPTPHRLAQLCELTGHPAPEETP